MLIVRYNGKKQPICLGCSDPKVLINGQLYEVFRIKCDANLKLYELKGIEGIFPSQFFTRIAESYDTDETQVWCKDQLEKENWRRKF